MNRLLLDFDLVHQEWRIYSQLITYVKDAERVVGTLVAGLNPETGPAFLEALEPGADGDFVVLLRKMKGIMIAEVYSILLSVLPAELVATEVHGGALPPFGCVVDDPHAAFKEFEELPPPKFQPEFPRIYEPKQDEDDVKKEDVVKAVVAISKSTARLKAEVETILLLLRIEKKMTDVERKLLFMFVKLMEAACVEIRKRKYVAPDF